MSTNITTTHEIVAQATVEAEPIRHGLMRKIGAAYLAWIAWRMQCHDIARLEAMDDRTLADIGLRRTEIGNAVRFGRHGG